MNEELKQIIIDKFVGYEVTFIDDRIIIKSGNTKHNIQYNESNIRYGQEIPDLVSETIFNYLNSIN
jgi:hypothetical protein